MARVTRKIEVVKEGDELFFKEESHKVPFRKIHCLLEFTVSKTAIRVERNGRLLVETSDVYYDGRSSSSRFYGLESLFLKGTQMHDLAEGFGRTALPSKGFHA